MHFAIRTLGCKVNQYESQVMRKNMIENGFNPAVENDLPNIIIINSCTVTAQSDQKVRQILNRSRRENPSAVVVLTGCMPQAFPDECADLEQADIILGNTSRKQLVFSINKFLSDGERIINIGKHEEREKFEDMQIDNFSERTRAIIKIEDGCNRFCSYCIIPYARGRVRSKSLDSISAEAQKLAEAGYKEIVLTGINLSVYGQDIETDLYSAIKSVSLIDGIERIRLGSLEPELFSSDIISKMSGISKLCPHFHLSLQSGCDETLKRMNRHYNSDDYRNIVKNLRKCFENPGITTDIMVGFPGESAEEFNSSLEFLKEMSFSKAHVFAYSRRKGTKAYDMPDQVRNTEKSRRSRLMSEASSKSALQFFDLQEGEICSVLFEEELTKGVFIGHSENYTPVKVISDNNLCGKIRSVKINSNDGSYCLGVILS